MDISLPGGRGGAVPKAECLSKDEKVATWLQLEPRVTKFMCTAILPSQDSSGSLCLISCEQEDYPQISGASYPHPCLFVLPASTVCSPGLGFPLVPPVSIYLSRSILSLPLPASLPSCDKSLSVFLMQDREGTVQKFPKSGKGTSSHKKLPLFHGS